MPGQSVVDADNAIAGNRCQNGQEILHEFEATCNERGERFGTVIAKYDSNSRVILKLLAFD